MPLSYRNDGIDYIGFEQYLGNPLVPGQQLVIARFDGEPDLYYTDGTKEAIDQIKKMYADEWGPDRVQDGDIRIFDPAP